MSDTFGVPDDDALGRAEDGSRYGPDNTRDDGSYRVGKGRPPTHTRFAVDDGRPRGKRGKGQRNFDTEFQEEASRLMTVRENGKERRVTKLRGAIIRSFDNACAKGDPRSLSLVFNNGARIGEKHAQTKTELPEDEAEVLDSWLMQRLAMISESEPEPVSTIADPGPDADADPEDAASPAEPKSEDKETPDAA